MKTDTVRTQIIDDIADAYQGTVMDGYAEVLNGFKPVADQLVANGTHLAVESQVFGISYELPEIEDTPTRVSQHEETMFRNRIREFSIRALGGAFRTDTQLIDFLVERSEHIHYCEPAVTKIHLADHYRDIRDMQSDLEADTDKSSLLVAKLNGDINQLSNMADELHEMFMDWDEELSVGMYGVLRLELDRPESQKNGYDIVFQLVEREITDAGVVTFRCERIVCPDEVNKHVNEHVLLGDEPMISPQYEPFCEFTDTRPQV